MRRAATAMILIAMALLLGAPFVTGVVFIVLLVALTATIFTLAGRRIRRGGGSLTPWVVSLVIGAIVTVPQTAVHQYKHVGAGVFAAIVGTLMLALLLRFVIFVVDYLRKRQSRRVEHQV
jgi:O-antigen/teichoic acid export membrane protein